MDDELDRLFDLLPLARPKPEPPKEPETPPRPRTPDPEHDDPIEACIPEPPKSIVECTAPTIALSSAPLSPFDPIEDQAFEACILRRLVRQLLNTGPFSLVDLEPFNGEGVYALYYHGSSPLYASIRSPGASCPIYIGKSARPGRHLGLEHSPGNDLFQRLSREHCVSLEQAGLGLENFTFRLVTLPSLWVDYAEHKLIGLFQPVWNTAIRGFGSRSCRSDARAASSASPWDTLHPGRPGAAAFPRDQEVVRATLEEALQTSARAYREALQFVSVG